MPKFEKRFARQHICEPPPEFPLASPYSGIVHHLSGPTRRAPTQTTLARKRRSAGGGTPHRLLCAPEGKPLGDSRACWTPWSVFQDGSIERPNDAPRSWDPRRTPRQSTDGHGRRRGPRRGRPPRLRTHLPRPGPASGRRRRQPRGHPTPARDTLERFPPDGFRHLSLSFQSPFHLSLTVLVRYRALVRI